MGRCCIEKWKSTQFVYGFKCPTCHTKLNSNDYHPIYDVPYEIFNPVPDFPLRNCLNEEEVAKHYLLDENNHKPIFFKNFEHNFEGSIKFYDVYNEYILIVGIRSSSDNDNQYIELIETNNGIKCFSIKLRSCNCSSLSFNKYQNDCIEFCIGFEDGWLQRSICSQNLSKFNIISEYYSEFGKIHSICYLSEEKFAFSVGKGGVFVCNINNISMTRNWARLHDSKRNIISNLQRFSDTKILGIMNGKIYVFEKDKVSYVLYNVVDTTIINYTVYLPSRILIIFYNKEDVYGNKLNVSQFYELCKIEKLFNDNNENQTKINSNIVAVKRSPSYICRFPTSFKPTLFITKELENYIIYLFIPNIKNKLLKAIRIDNEANCLAEELVENLNDFITILCIGKPQLFIKNILRMQIVVIFKKKLTVLNFYYPINE
ncbi:WD40-repeat-containing domain-containing protein [Strongyloides ratti]|uniref:WD40-repeat-containing domain-containing protein n=1 Tax=Strongyloides ratti TaxID=34506 RepID=A0A090MU66_STRRB|nr:WD40-repeat-containing domain-containing protein [Strongyloides ratti]CEF62023.1 WD40-repeat-containing domain-containing protein [Strongyloides ratti]